MEIRKNLVEKKLENCLEIFKISIFHSYEFPNSYFLILRIGDCRLKL